MKSIILFLDRTNSIKEVESVLSDNFTKQELNTLVRHYKIKTLSSDTVLGLKQKIAEHTLCRIRSSVKC